MNFPLNAFHAIGLDATLLISLLIGVGFGFMLERGGFGSSKVLSGIFYARDWRVLKVMFTAIVTAMIGLYAAQGMGWVMMDQIAFRPTYLGGQVVGGLLLGIGFVTAGYCPGTSMVGLVSGKIDAAFVMLGILLGIGVFEEFFTTFVGLRDWGEMGRVSLSDWMGIPTGIVVLMVVAMALGAFALVGWLERQRQANLRPLRRWAGSGSAVAGAVLVAAVQFAGPGDARPMGPDPADASLSSTAITPQTLAAWMVEGDNGYLMIDLRSAVDAVEFPQAWVMAAVQLTDLRQRPDLPTDRVLLLVDASDDGSAREVADVLRDSGMDARALAGGAKAWHRDILEAEDGGPAARALRMMSSGKSPLLDGSAPPPVPKVKTPPPTRAKKKGGDCS